MLIVANASKLEKKKKEISLNSGSILQQFEKHWLLSFQIVYHKDNSASYYLNLSN